MDQTRVEDDLEALDREGLRRLIALAPAPLRRLAEVRPRLAAILFDAAQAMALLVLVVGAHAAAFAWWSSQ